MENNTCLVNSSPYGRESGLLMTAGVAGDPYLAAGLLLGSVLLGLVSYISAFWSQRRRLKEAFNSQRHNRLRGAQNIHLSIMFGMLLQDFVNALFAIILAILVIEIPSSPGLHYAIYSLWYMFRCYGLIYHLLNALLCVLFSCHPQSGDNQHGVYVLLVLSMYVFLPFHFLDSQVEIFGLGAITIGLALAIIAKCTVSSASPSAATQKKPIVFVAMFTFLIVYAPSFILQCLMISTANRGEPTDKFLTIYVNVLLCTNFQLLMDGLLCYFNLKLPSEEREQQQRELEQHQHQSFENSNYNNDNSVFILSQHHDNCNNFAS